jgi:hypothetical protein
LDGDEEIAARRGIQCFTFDWWIVTDENVRYWLKVQLMCSDEQMGKLGAGERIETSAVRFPPA